MTTPLSVWQELLLLALAALSTIYVFYFRIWLAIAVGSDVLFALALALTVASIAVPSLFRDASTALIDRSPLPDALARADARVAEIEALPRTLIDRALARIGYAPDGADGTAEATPTPSENGARPRTLPDPARTGERPTPNAPDPRAKPAPIWSDAPRTPSLAPSGPFVSSVRPSVESLVASVLRIASFACGSFLILTALAMRSSTTTARRLQGVHARIEALEATLAMRDAQSNEATTTGDGTRS